MRHRRLEIDRRALRHCRHLIIARLRVGRAMVELRCLILLGMIQHRLRIAGLSRRGGNILVVAISRNDQGVWRILRRRVLILNCRAGLTSGHAGIACHRWMIRARRMPGMIRRVVMMPLRE